MEGENRERPALIKKPGFVALSPLCSLSSPSLSLLGINLARQGRGRGTEEKSRKRRTSGRRGVRTDGKKGKRRDGAGDEKFLCWLRLSFVFASSSPLPRDVGRKTCGASWPGVEDEGRGARWDGRKEKHESWRETRQICLLGNHTHTQYRYLILCSWARAVVFVHYYQVDSIHAHTVRKLPGPNSVCASPRACVVWA